MKSNLRTKVEKFFASNRLSKSDDLYFEVKTAEEAEELCLIVKENLHRPSYAARLLRMFQPDEPAELVVETFRREGMPVLLELEPKLETTSDGFGDDRLFLLKLLAMYGTAEGAERVVSVAQAGYGSDQYLWSVVFGCFSPEHPESKRVFAAFDSALPSGFAAVSLLDAANRCAAEGMTFQHPFDSSEGVGHLRRWLRDLDPEKFSYAVSATTALPFITEPARDELLQLAMDHPDTRVSVEAAWASAKVGLERGIRELGRYAKDVNTASVAIHYLTELGREDAIPPEATEPDFQAMAEMVQWLSHPNEFGEPPAKITVYDTRELFWPPTNDRRQVWLLRYEYPKSGYREEEDIGLGMTGSITFALFGETTPNLSPVEAYALHCCFELESNSDPRAPKNKSIAAGMAILAKYNDLPAIVDGPVSASHAPAGDSPRQAAADSFVRELLAKAKEKQDGAGESKKEALRSAMKDMMDVKVRELRKASAEIQKELAQQRKAAPIVQTAVRPGSDDVLQRPEAAVRRTALESAGYRLEGVFSFDGIPGFDIALFVHPENGTVASVNCDETITTELSAEYQDGTLFHVQDTASKPGLTPPPWATYQHEPGLGVPELVDLFESKRPPGHRHQAGAEAVAATVSNFRRLQLWRMERGGWHPDEVQAQMGITDLATHQDEFESACLKSREKWLFAWLKDNHPKLAEELEETVIIIHDELDPSLLFLLWIVGGGSADVMREHFEGENPRAIIHATNEDYNRPLTLIARKTDGYPADFYRPTIIKEK